MKDDQLYVLLRSLPGREASPDFTTRVLARLERSESAPQKGAWRIQSARLGLATVGLLLLLVGLLLWVAPDRFAPGPAGEEVVTRERVHELRTEYEILEEELQELRLLSAESQPLVGVRGDDGIDYLVDLRELISSAGRAQSTSYRFDH